MVYILYLLKYFCDLNVKKNRESGYLPISKQQCRRLKSRSSRSHSVTCNMFSLSGMYVYRSVWSGM